MLHCGKRGPKYGLKDLVKNYFDKDLDKDTRNQFVKLQGQPYTDKQMQYGAEDVEYLIDIRLKQLPQIADKKLEELVQLENMAVLAFSDIEYNGLDLDQEAWLKLDNENEGKAKEYYQDLDNAVLQDPRLEPFVLMLMVKNCISIENMA